MHRHAPTTRAALFFFSLFLLLVLSGAPAFAAAPPYTVKAGDTLWDIAASHNLTVDALVAANHLDAGAL
ncbi:MAG TPA: LysM peptidoglycan-binding domain-containing protein, partial [Anaerolineae bacterium]